MEHVHDWQSRFNARGNTANSKNKTIRRGYFELSALGATLRSFSPQFSFRSYSKRWMEKSPNKKKTKQNTHTLSHLYSRVQFAALPESVVLWPTVKREFQAQCA